MNTIHLGWPQIIMLGFWFMGLGISIARHGQPRSPENAGISFIGGLVTMALLYWGGFFS